MMAGLFSGGSKDTLSGFHQIELFSGNVGDLLVIAATVDICAQAGVDLALAAHLILQIVQLFLSGLKL